ncbi:MAG: 50S ribosomal protein L29 [Candidatus Margulisbacteria bacterium]|jgi:ribosomal protein L29|nr:50S ribosomal protein L29 [Candidatus Margulisiibacteriota bacterium]
MLDLQEIKKLDAAGLYKKVAELKKDYFEKKQKLLRGEHKDISEFRKIRRTIARLLTVFTALPAADRLAAVRSVPKAGVKIDKTEVKPDKQTGQTEEAKEAKKVKKPKAEKPAKKAAARPAKAKKEEKSK